MGAAAWALWAKPNYAPGGSRRPRGSARRLLRFGSGVPVAGAASLEQQTVGVLALTYYSFQVLSRKPPRLTRTPHQTRTARRTAQTAPFCPPTAPANAVQRLSHTPLNGPPHPVERARLAVRRPSKPFLNPLDGLREPSDGSLGRSTGAVERLK